MKKIKIIVVAVIVLALIVYYKKPMGMKSLPALHSETAILVSSDHHKPLLEKSSHKRIYPASLTKMMTLLVAIEENPDLNKEIQVPSSIFPTLHRENAALAGFRANEIVSIKDLLFGTMLPSGADAALTLAIASNNKEENFVKKMNEKAKKLKMKDTHFTNVTGLHDQNHYSTASDLAILLSYALQNSTFKTIFTSKSYWMPPTNIHREGISMYSTLFSQMDSPIFDGGAIIGGKTGYTPEAGLCLASVAVKDGKEYILITTGANGDHNTEPYHINDALTVFEGI